MEKKKNKSQNVKALDDYIKAYDHHKISQQSLDKVKESAIDYLQKQGSLSLNYKDSLFTLCEKKTYDYTKNIRELQNSLAKHKKIEELDGSAKVKSASAYIRLTEVQNANK